MAITPGSRLEALRQARHGTWLEELRRRIAAALAPAAGWQAVPCEVHLFGSRARGDWDGYSDTDLLVVAEAAEQAERVADRLREAGVGDDVLALGSSRWDSMAGSDSPYWRAIRAQAVCLYREPG
jgi:hypothetical protein